MAPKKTSANTANYWKLLSIGLLTFIIGYATGNLTGGTCTADDCNANVLAAGADKVVEKVDLADLPSSSDEDYYILGDEDAPVTIIEYTDYQCPFCQRYYFNTFPSIKDEYIATGKVKYLVKDMALSFHSKAKPSAYAARCAGEQENYWEMHDKIFLYQNQWSYAEDTQAQFTTYAEELELDLNEFTTCYENGSAKFDAQIEKDIAEATSKGLSGTPSFSINNQTIVGAQGFEAFKAAIDSEL